MSNKEPRLQFTKAERADPELQKPIQKVEKAAAKADAKQARIPKKTVKVKEYTLDPQTGKLTKRLLFEEVDKKKPPSKLAHAVRDAPGAAVLAGVHKEIRKSEDDNLGVESAHKLEETAETGGRFLQSAHRSRQLKPYRQAEKAEAKLEKANVSFLQKQAASENPQFSSNPISRWQQKRNIQKQYAAAKRTGQSAAQIKQTAQNTAKAAKKAAEGTKETASFIWRHKKGVAIVLGIGLMLVFFLNGLSSCSVLFQGGTGAVAISTYPSEDADMLGAEAAYSGMEAELQEYLDTYESTHDYDEYHYDLDEIEHDPYVLISILTAWHEGVWTLDEAQGTLQMLFDKQYILTETVETEVRYRTETRTGSYSYTDPETGETVWEDYEYDVQVPYDYYICTVMLENFNLSHVPVYIMGENMLSMYALYMSVLGNRPDLFPGSEYISKYITNRPEDYEIPPEVLADETFAAMMEEAQKYVGYPYVWGGSSPSTSFDCSGFVSWVINHSGWDVGRLGAQGLCNICTPVSSPQPGDLVFFTGTYDTPGVSHVGIYVGNDMMLHAGDPINYTNLNSSYWQGHFYRYGRLP